MGVIEFPFRNRRTRDDRGKGAGRLFRELERQIAAIGPAISDDPRGIDEGLRFQPFDAGKLVRDLDRAHGAIDVILERLAPIGRAAIV